MPVEGDAELFERLALESFQAGLSWSTILRKREGFRAAFEGFDPAVVAAYGPHERERLLADAGDRPQRRQDRRDDRKRAALLATNAEFGSFAAYLASIVPGPPLPLPPDAAAGSIPASTPVSDALSKDLGGAASSSSARRSCTRSCRASASSTTTCPVFPVSPGRRDTLAVTGPCECSGHDHLRMHLVRGRDGNGEPRRGPRRVPGLRRQRRDRAGRKPPPSRSFSPPDRRAACSRSATRPIAGERAWSRR